MMKTKNPISEIFISQLNDWEIISAYTYCSNMISNDSFKEEFLNFSFFFFDNNHTLATEIINESIELYRNAYSKRHLN